MSSGVVVPNFLMSSRIIPLVGGGSLGGGPQGRTHECSAKQKEHST
jgi:hypothetical protein